MKIATTTGSALTAQSARQLKACGYDAVDYSGAIYAYEPYTGIYTLPDDAFDAYFRRDGKLLADAGLEVYQAHAPYHTIPDDESETDFMRQCIRRSIRATAMVGGTYLVIHPAQPMHWSTDLHPDRTRDYNLRLFAELLPLAHEWNVRLALENMPGAGIPAGTPASLIDYIDAMGDPDWFVACLDTGHANFSGVDCGAFVRLLGPRLKALHVHDNHGARDEHLGAFMGTVAWEPFVQALADVGYSGAFSFESGFAGQFPEGFSARADALQAALGKYLCETHGL